MILMYNWSLIHKIWHRSNFYSFLCAQQYWFCYEGKQIITKTLKNSKLSICQTFKKIETALLSHVFKNTKWCDCRFCDACVARSIYTTFFIHRILAPEFLTLKEPRNRFQGINSTSLWSLAGRNNNPVLTRFLAPIDCLKIPALLQLYRVFTRRNIFLVLVHCKEKCIVSMKRKFRN